MKEMNLEEFDIGYDKIDIYYQPKPKVEKISVNFKLPEICQKNNNRNCSSKALESYLKMMGEISKYKKFSLDKNKENWYLQIAYQLWKAKDENSYDIQDWHKDVLINNKVVQKYINLLKEKNITAKTLFNDLYQNARKNYNIKLLADITEFREIVSSKDGIEELNCYLLGDLIILDKEINEEHSKNIDHSWIKDYITKDNITNNKEIYKNGKFKISFDDGYIFLEDLKKNMIYSTQVKFENYEFCL